jgi:hypothetical protein
MKKIKGSFFFKKKDEYFFDTKSFHNFVVKSLDDTSLKFKAINPTSLSYAILYYNKSEQECLNLHTNIQKFILDTFATYNIDEKLKGLDINYTTNKINFTIIIDQNVIIK